MKKIFIPFVIAATTLSFAACQKEVSSPAIEDELVSLNFTSANPTTKTVADAVNKTILWEKGDKISIAYTVADKWQNASGDATTNNQAKIYVSNGLAAGGETAVFNISGDFNSTATGVHQFYSVYPSSCVKSNNIKYAPSVTMTIPDVQTPAENSFDAAADLMIGKATKTYNSLSDARADAIPLLWQRIVSHADITLKGLQGLTENEVITTIVLTADAEAKLVGDRWIDIQNGNILGPKTITDANILTINGTNLKVNSNNVEFWAAVMPATVKSLNIVVETNKATYTRNIESCNIVFKQNARKGLNVDMSSVERVEKEAPASWIATDLADITATDEVVITMANDKGVYALTSAKGSSAAPTAVAVTVKNKELTATPADNLVWNIANDNENLTIYPKGQTTTWLYTTKDNNGVRVGKNENKTFVVDSKSGYLKNTTTSRYLGVYNNSDWRCYTSTSTNIGGQTLCFYVKGGPIDNTRPTLSVDQTSKVWAANATDAFVVNVTVNSEGGDWTVTPETLSWATIAVDKTAGTITVTPNGANETKTANEATLTVTHTSDASLTKEISLKQNAAGGAAMVDKTATIKFGTNDVKISQASVTANDDQKNSWTITTVGTTSFTPNPDYNQVGSSKKPATSITFTTTLPEDAEVTSISAKFGGFNETQGTITLKVGNVSVGTGKLEGTKNGTDDVIVTNTSTAAGNKVTITVTNIAKGVKCYNIQVKYKTAN